MLSKAIFFSIIVLFLLTLPVYSEIYHIDPEANAGGVGSPTNPLNSWWDLPLRAMKTGDQVYFKCNTTYSPSLALSVKWEGNAENPVVIGSYYIENSKAVYGVKGNRPIISGSEYRVPENKHFGTTDSWRGLIHVKDKDYVHIKDLHILKSGFGGIRIEGDLMAGTDSIHPLIQNVRVEGAYHTGLLIAYNKNNYGIIEDCDVSGSGYGWYIGARSDWPAAVTVAQCPYSYTKVRRNYVHENWGEGICSIRVPDTDETANSGYATIEDNIVWNNRRVDIYIGRTEGNIARRNILLGAGADAVGDFSSSYQGDRDWNQYGIWINAENRGGNTMNTSNNSVYNNLIAGHVSGIGIASEFSEGTLENVYFFNNTLIANIDNISIGPKLSGYNMKNVEFKNNISYCPKGTNCSDIKSDYSWYGSKIKSDYNAWTTKPSNFGGPNDQQVDNNWVKTQGWQDLNGIPDIQDFAMTAGNPAIGSGAVLEDVYKHAIDLTKTSYDPNRPAGISVATIPQDKTGSGWDMGAVVFQNKSVPMEPPILSIVP